jgi:hypothetical protein
LQVENWFKKKESRIRGKTTKKISDRDKKNGTVSASTKKEETKESTLEAVKQPMKQKQEQQLDARAKDNRRSQDWRS